MEQASLKNSILLLTEVTAITVLLSFFLYFIHYLIKRRNKSLASQDYFWQKAVLASLYKPISTFIIFSGLSMIAQFAAGKYDISLLKFSVNLRQVGIILAVTWFLLLMIKQLERYLTRVAKVSSDFADKSTADILSKVLHSTVLTIAIIVILQTSGFSIDAILALGGLGGAAITLAGRDFLANLFGTLSLYLDKPFEIGDKIRVGADKGPGIEGTVERITWRSTKIRSEDQRPIHIPNIQFSLVATENASRVRHERLKGYVELYFSNPHVVRRRLEMLQQHLENSFEIVELEITAFTENTLKIKFAVCTPFPIKNKAAKRDLLLSLYEAVSKASDIFNLRLE